LALGGLPDDARHRHGIGNFVGKARDLFLDGMWVRHDEAAFRDNEINETVLPSPFGPRPTRRGTIGRMRKKRLSGI
jgi:hypothetical protein